MMYYLTALALTLLLTGEPITADIEAEKKECVIVLHGLGRTHNSMNQVEQALLKEGYFVWNESYPSRLAPIQILSAKAIENGLDYCKNTKATKYHFVTHSLGGILIRHYLQSNSIDNLEKIVMLGPPNQGSEVADKLKDNYLYQQYTGPAGQEIGTDENSLPNRLKPIPGTIGIIAGSFSSDPWFSPIIPGEDDGKVSVMRTRLKEMNDFIVVSSGHTFMMHDHSVIEQIIYFLSNGKFDHSIPEKNTSFDLSP